MTSRRERLESDARRIWARAEPIRPLLLVLALGVLLRGYLMGVYSPVAAVFNDSIVYLTSSHDHLLDDPFRPAGYPLFLRILRYVIDELSFVIAVQHLLGLATGALLYVTVLRVTKRRWLSAMPAAVVVLSGDQLLLEHSLLTESLYTFLVTAALCGAVFAKVEGGRLGLILLTVSGFALGAAGTVRTVAVPLAFLVPLWLLLTASRTVRRRVTEAVSFGGAALVIILTLVGAQGALTGTWGITRASGWALYPRVAPFADCGEFDPPSGTEFLCETTPSRSSSQPGRPGPAYYQFVDGPGIRRFGNPFQTNARGNEVVRRFAVAAMLGQPVDYLREVGRDAARYLVPTAGYDRPYSFAGSEEVDIARRAPEAEDAIVKTAEAVGFDADPVDADDSSIHLLQDFQHALRIQGVSLVVLLALALIGLIIGIGVVRAAAGLFLGAALVQALVPVATLGWGFRYGVPVIGQVASAAALGIHVMLQRQGHSHVDSP